MAKSHDADQYNAFRTRLEQLAGGEGLYSWAGRLGFKDIIGNIDRYKHIPRRTTLQRIADATGCNLDWLLTGEESPNPESLQTVHAKRAYQQFRQRLDALIGAERPYSWAARLGIKSTLSDIDRRGVMPRHTTIVAMAAKIGCSPEWLEHGTGEPFPPNFVVSQPAAVPEGPRLGRYQFDKEVATALEMFIVAAEQTSEPTAEKVAKVVGVFSTLMKLAPQDREALRQLLLEGYGWLAARKLDFPPERIARFLSLAYRETLLGYEVVQAVDEVGKLAA